MRTSLATCIAVVLAAAAPFAQSVPLDITGHWRLVEPTPVERARDTLEIDAPDELLITQTARDITIQHPSKPGRHPEARTFEYGVGGRVGGLSGQGTSINEKWGVTHIGTQLMISRSTTRPPDERGIRATVAYGSMWRLESPDRLVIEFGERRTGERPKVATRIYVKVGSQ